MRTSRFETRRRARGGAVALLVSCTFFIGAARADNGIAPPAVIEQVPAPRKAPRFALGASFGFLRGQDLGRELETQIIPSLVGVAYVNVARRLYLRPGLRLGFPGVDQPRAASDARVEEHGVQGKTELGILYDGWLVPSLSVGAGLERRSIKFVASGLAQDSSLLNRTEWLGSLYGQVGLGLPLFHGFLVVEPYARVLHTFSDDRAWNELGFDVTFAL